MTSLTIPPTSPTAAAAPTRGPLARMAMFLALAGALLAALGAADQASAQSGVWNYRTVQVLQFEQTSGQPQWAQRALAGLSQSQYQFRGDGTIVASVPSSAFRHVGRWSGRGVVSFVAEWRTNYGYTGGTRSVLRGRVNFNGAQPVASVSLQTGSITAACVNGTCWGANNASGYTAVLRLQRI